MGVVYVIVETIKIFLTMIILLLGVSGEVNAFICILAIAVITVAHKRILKQILPENKLSENEK